jgi:hypothetical protein
LILMKSMLLDLQGATGLPFTVSWSGLVWIWKLDVWLAVGLDQHDSIGTFVLPCFGGSFWFAWMQVFVANPNKPRDIIQVLVDNHRELLKLLHNLPTGKGTDVLPTSNLTVGQLG